MFEKSRTQRKGKSGLRKMRKTDMTMVVMDKITDLALEMLEKQGLTSKAVQLLKSRRPQQQLVKQ